MKNISIFCIGLVMVLLCAATVQKASYATTNLVVHDSINQYINPYCNYNPASLIVPFFDPCPEGSHIDGNCAIVCGMKYRNAVANVYRDACAEFNNLTTKVRLDMIAAYDVEHACILSGGIPAICQEQCSATIIKIGKDFDIDAKALQNKLALKLDEVLGNYYDCLLACPCLEIKIK